MTKLGQIECAFSTLKGSYEELETSVRAMLGMLEDEPRKCPPIVATLQGRTGLGDGVWLEQK
jgi:hypothetical protein